MMKNGPADQVLQLVRERTGRPVHVEPDHSLPSNVLAKLDVARGGSPFHRIAIHPSVIQKPDYLIVYQAGFLLRRFAVLPDQRRDFSEHPRAEETVRRWVENTARTRNLAELMNPRMIRFLCSGLLSQLRSMPVGLRVDDWIRKDYPELEGLQRKAVDRQLNDNAAGLQPEVQRVMPAEALRASLGMNAAFALYWARTLDLPQVVIPYRAAGFEKVGNALLECWDRIPSGPEADDALVDAWANLLGMADWYRWSEEHLP